MEDKVLKLLASLEKEEQIAVKLGSLFSVSSPIMILPHTLWCLTGALPWCVVMGQHLS